MSYIGLFPNGEHARHHLTLCYGTAPNIEERMQTAILEVQYSISKILPIELTVADHMMFGTRRVAIVEQTSDLLKLHKMFAHLADRKNWIPHVTEQDGILWGIGVTMTFSILEARE
jgi:hypothetical protein